MAQRRYRHFMAVGARLSSPGKVLCVDVQSRIAQKDTEARSRTEELLGWDASMVSRRRKRIHSGIPTHGSSPTEFWMWLGSACAGKRTLSVLSWGCTRTWSLLRLWEMIENGEITTTIPVGCEGPESGRQGDQGTVAVDGVQGQAPADPGSVLPEMSGVGLLPSDRPGERGRRTVQALRDGYCTMEDPPNIVSFYLWGIPTRITWWDARNWGCPPPNAKEMNGGTLSLLTTWYMGLSALCQSHSGGAPSVTAGAWALGAFKAKHYDGGIYVHTNRDALALEGQAYIGGRCEAYRLGRWPGTWTMVDMRSAYLWACAHTAVPVRLVEGPSRHHGADITCIRPDRGVIAHVLVDVYEPCVPMRREHDVIYPVGRFWTALCYPEIALAAKHGQILDVDGACVYEMEYALERWAHSIYELRLRAEAAGDKSVSAAVKMAGIALVGKLGQRQRSWERWPDGDGAIQWGECWGGDAAGVPRRYRYIGGECWQAVDRGWSPDACPAIAAWITSVTRVRLWELQQQAGRQHVAYCDTDCLTVDEQGLSQLPLYPAEDATLPLGCLTIRAQGPLEIWGLKHYRIGARHVCAGMPRGVITGSPDGKRHWWTPGAGQQIAAGKRPDATGRAYSMPFPGSYKHGTVMEDGTVLPLQIREE